MRIWSEVPDARRREAIADLATLAWVLLWGSAAWSLYSLIAGYAEAGRLVEGGGENLRAAGAAVGAQLRGLPLVGPAVGDAVRLGFEGAGGPIASAGQELEAFVLVIGASLALMVLVVPLVPWLALYVPWRARRAGRVRAAHRVIRRPGAAEAVSDLAVDRVLAGRALNRLEWPVLLAFTPDPIGDWESGRFDRLARAEYESAGLRRAE